MAIVKMDKFILLAFENQKSALLEKLQSFQNVEFSNLNDEKLDELTSLKQDDSGTEISNVQDILSRLDYSIKLLERFEPKKNMLTDLKEGKKTFTYEELEVAVKEFDWEDVYKKLQHMDKEISQGENLINKLKTNIEDLRPWRNMDVEISKLKSLKTSKVALGIVPTLELESLRQELDEKYDNYYLEIVGTTGKDSNILAVFPNDEFDEGERILKSHNFSKYDVNCSETPQNAMLGYEEEISKEKTKISEIQTQMKEYLPKLDNLKMVYEYNSCYLTRLNSTDKFLRSNSIVAIVGYYPSDLKAQFENQIKDVLHENYYLETETAEGDDTPVKLKNNKVFEAFEDITTMYSVPRYKEIDPTPLFAPFYIVFFGMMLSDAGYGLLMLIGTLVALKFFNLDPKLRKTVKMFSFLSVSTIFWGVMYGSYFGDFLERFIPVRALWMKPDSNVTLLMLVSIAMGLIQIFVGLGIKGYMQVRDKDYFGMFSDVILWYAVLTGAILWILGGFVGALSPGVTNVAKYITIASMVGIVLTNGREEKSIGGKLGQGFYKLYGISSYVGDLVSYTRLAALGLATGFISYAFNVMVDMVSGFWLTAATAGVLIFVIGHLFNLFINALGSYVHASRLQYLEYFGKFYEGGGKSFSPLTYDSKYFNIVKDKN